MSDHNRTSPTEQNAIDVEYAEQLARAEVLGLEVVVVDRHERIGWFAMVRRERQSWAASRCADRAEALGTAIAEAVHAGMVTV